MRAFLIFAAGVTLGALTMLALPKASPTQLAASDMQQAVAAPAGSVQGAAASNSAKELFRAPLPEIPGKQLVVVPLQFPMSNSVKRPAHQHPGSVFVYVPKGEARLGVEGQEPKLISAGQGFFEPVGAIHNVNESVGSEQATAIAFMIVPDGAPLVMPSTTHPAP